MRVFFQLPTKVVLIAFMLTWLSLSTGMRPAVAVERKPMMDLKNGGVGLFYETVPSIVQIFNGGSGGSGYVIDREGYLITNAHVSGGMQAVEIAFYGDEENNSGYESGRWKGTLIAEDPAVDLAVMKVEAPAEKFHPVRLGDSATIKAGDTCATFGSPGGDPNWVDRSSVAWQDSWLEYYNLNLGVVTEVLNFEEAFWTNFQGFGENMEVRSGNRTYGTAVEYLFHVDAAINHGNSGGPFLNVYGEACGTNTWGFGGENVGFSVPINLLKKSVTDILEYGRVRRPWCGIALHPSVWPHGEMYLEQSIGTYEGSLGMPWDSTPDVMEIKDVNPYSPAYAAGIRKGDVLIRVDGVSYDYIFDVYSYFLNRELGNEVVIEVERGGLPMPPMKVVIGEKLERYYGRDIQVGGAGPWVGSYTQYTDNLTY